MQDSVSIIYTDVPLALEENFERFLGTRII